MSGNKPKGNRRVRFVLQERDRYLLRELSTMRVIDREQAQVVVAFPSLRRCNRRLLALTREGLLRRIFVANAKVGQKALYTLSPKAAALVGARLGGLPFRQTQFGASPFLLQRLAINEIYLLLKHRLLPAPNMRLARWISFREPLTQASPLIPDGYFEVVTEGGTRAMFLEADLGTESLPVWQKKAQLYLQIALSGQFTEMFRQPQFRVLVIATTDRRLRHIRTIVAKATDKVFWFSTFEQIKQRGFWSPIWLRPTGDQPVPLL
jgi:protein involved in plasmid replication-relaxation